MSKYEITRSVKQNFASSNSGHFDWKANFIGFFSLSLNRLPRKLFHNRFANIKSPKVIVQSFSIIAVLSLFSVTILPSINKGRVSHCLLRV